MAITSTEILQHCPAVWKLRNKLTRFMSLLKITAKGRQAGKGQVLFLKLILVRNIRTADAAFFDLIVSTEVIGIKAFCLKWQDRESAS